MLEVPFGQPMTPITCSISVWSWSSVRQWAATPVGSEQPSAGNAVVVSTYDPP
jgi:hypothetical protein